MSDTSIIQSPLSCSHKEKTHRPMSLSETVLPIVQPLAPCLAVGCCAVNGAVPRALFMVMLIITLLPQKCNG